MLAVIIFYLHTVFGVYAFVRRWQEENMKEGFLTLAFVLLIFFVGWTLSTFLVWTIGAALTLTFSNKLRDTLSLSVLLVTEGSFYYFYLRGKISSKDKEEIVRV